jgi:hypothetical protein
LVGQAAEAIAELKEAYGVELTVDEFLGELENGGMAAYAAVTGKSLPELGAQLTKQILREAYENKNWRSLQGKAAKPQPGESAKKGAGIPDLNRGGGSRERREALTDDELIDRDLAEAKAKAGS